MAIPHLKAKASGGGENRQIGGLISGAAVFRGLPGLLFGVTTDK
jgi:hypothetical protein